MLTQHRHDPISVKIDPPRKKKKKKNEMKIWPRGHKERENLVLRVLGRIRFVMLRRAALKGN